MLIKLIQGYFRSKIEREVRKLQIETKKSSERLFMNLIIHIYTCGGSMVLVVVVEVVVVVVVVVVVGVIVAVTTSLPYSWKNIRSAAQMTQSSKEAILA